MSGINTEGNDWEDNDWDNWDEDVAENNRSQEDKICDIPNDKLNNEKTNEKTELNKNENSWGIWGVLNKVIAPGNVADDGNTSKLPIDVSISTVTSTLTNSVLDTLECIGKKTMNILQENDLLTNKKILLGLDSEKPNLSEVLNEARNDAVLLEKSLKELKVEKNKEQIRFDIIFENQCGLAHLEALEILSKESQLKLQTLLDSVSGNALAELHETIDIVTELMNDELDADSDGSYNGNELRDNLLNAIADADLSINFDDIVDNWNQSIEWISAHGLDADMNEIFVKGITTLATTCALETAKLHKISELLLVKQHHSTANEVDAVVQLCKQFNTHLTGEINRFANLLIARDETQNIMTALFSELLNATQQISKAFKLFLPILQIGAI